MSSIDGGNQVLVANASSMQESGVDFGRVAVADMQTNKRLIQFCCFTVFGHFRTHLLKCISVQRHRRRYCGVGGKEPFWVKWRRWLEGKR